MAPAPDGKLETRNSKSETGKTPDADSAAAAPHTSIFGDSAEVRLEYWKAGWELAVRHPWLGVGPGNFADHYLAFRTPEGSETRHAHNDYLEIAVEQGFTGLAAFLAVWVAWFIGMSRRAREFAGDAEEDAATRLAFAVVVGAAGVAAVAFALSRYLPTTETRLMLLAGSGIWLAVYAAQARSLMSADAGRLAKGAPLLRAAAAAGVGALLVHFAIDFDFNEPGVMAGVAGMAAAGLALRERRPPASARAFGATGQSALVIVVAGPILAALVMLVYPLIDMSVALEQAHAARDESARLLRESDRWRALGNTRGADALRMDAEQEIRVNYPRLLDEAAKACPLNPDLWMEMAQLDAAAARGNTSADALARLDERLDRVKSLAAQDPAPYVLKAQVLSDRLKEADARGDGLLAESLAEQALAEIDAAVARYPAHPRMRLIRAKLLDRLDHRTEAVAEYRLAVSLAESTSEKELKFTPDDLREIHLALRRLEKPGAGR